MLKELWEQLPFSAGPVHAHQLLVWKAWHPTQDSEPQEPEDDGRVLEEPAVSSDRSWLQGHGTRWPRAESCSTILPSDSTKGKPCANHIQGKGQPGSTSTRRKPS